MSGSQNAPLRRTSQERDNTSNDDGQPQQQQQQNDAGPIPPHNTAARNQATQHVYCGLSQDKLYELLEKYIENPGMYATVFFNVYKKLGLYEKCSADFGTDSNDHQHRCTECGRTIAQHPATTTAFVAADGAAPPAAATAFDAAKDNIIPPVATVQVLESLLANGRLSVKGLDAHDPAKYLVAYIGEKLFPGQTVDGLDRGRILPNDPDKHDPMMLFLDGVRQLHENCGRTVDKRDLPLLAVAGASGTGKTEFLRTIAARLDTVRPLPTDNNNSNNNDDDDDDEGIAYDTKLGEKLQESFDEADKAVSDLRAKNPSASGLSTPAQFDGRVIVMFATFNQNSGYNLSLDTTTRIVNRTVSRMLNDYFGFKDIKGNETLHKFTSSHIDFLELAAFMRKFVAKNSQNNSSNSSNTPAAPAIIFCIDELRRIDEYAARKALLDSVAGTQQDELQTGLPTFFIVSSLDLFPMVDEWVTWSKRKMLAIPLPLLPAPLALRDSLLLLVRARCSQDEAAVWLEYVTAMLDSTGGHADTLCNRVSLLDKVRGSPLHRVPPFGVAPNASLALAIWNHCFKYTVAGRARHVPHDDVCCDIQTQDRTSLGYLTKNNVISYATLPFDPRQQQPNKGPQFFVELSVAPSEFFSYLETDNAATVPADKALMENATFVRDAVWTIYDVVAFKSWEKGMIAALAVVARAHLDLRRSNPTLGELLPAAHFFNDQLKQWRVPIQSRYNIVDVDTTAADPSSMWCSAAHCNNNSNRDVLARFSTLSNQEAIEGIIELVDENGDRAAGGIQMKMKTNSDPAEVHAWSNAALDFTKATLGGNVVAKSGKKESASAKKGPSSCVLLFCSGEASTCANNAGLVGKDVVLIGTNACKALLSPFGASVLLRKLERRTRTSVAAAAAAAAGSGESAGAE